MSKFEVGDRVEYIGTMNTHRGRIGVVTGVRPSNACQIKWENKNGKTWHYDAYMKLLETVAFIVWNGK